MYRRAATRQFSTLKSRKFSTLKPRQFSTLKTRQFSTLVANGQNLRLSHVKLRKPPLRRRIFNGLPYAVIFLALCYYWLDWIGLEIEIAGDDKKVKPDASLENNEEEEMEDGWFIPFGWPKKEEKTYFKASDPEWKAFLKLAKDPKRQEDIQAQLVKEIRLEVARSFRVLMRQKLFLDSGRAMLTIIYPEGPPQDYGVFGIEIGGDFIAWSKKAVPQHQYQKLSKAVMPTAGLKAGWKVIRYNYMEQANKVRQYLGMKPKFDPENEAMKFMFMAHVAEKKRAEQGEKKNIAPPLVPPINKKEATSTSSTGSKAESSTPPESGEEKEAPSKLSAYFPKADPAPLSSYIFVRNLLKQDKTKPNPPAGCIEVKGSIEVVHQQTVMTVDVDSNYDLTTNRFVDKTFTVKGVRNKSQRPKGGPG